MNYLLLKNNFYFEPLEQFEVVKLFYYNFLTKTLSPVFSFFLRNLLDSKVLLLDRIKFVISIEDIYRDNNYDILIFRAFHEPNLVPFYYLDLETIKILNFKLYPSYLFDSFDSSVDAYNLVELSSVNNIFIYFFLIISFILFLIVPVTNKLHLLSNNWQIVIENLYNFNADMLLSQIGKIAQKFFPYIFSIFMFILISNVLGMALFAFTVTSHIIITFTLGVSSFIGLTILGFFIQKLSFLELFVPKGIPKLLLPMLVIIEIISYLSRALSLSIRLFANLMSGHTLLHILAFFSSKLFKYKFVIGLISFLLILAIVSLEFCIALLQAYVFAILICIYLNDSFNVSH